MSWPWELEVFVKVLPGFIVTGTGIDTHGLAVRRGILLGETANTCLAIEWYFLIIQASDINAELCCSLHVPVPSRDLSKQQEPYKIVHLTTVDNFCSFFLCAVLVARYEENVFVLNVTSTSVSWWLLNRWCFEASCWIINRERIVSYSREN